MDNEKLICNVCILNLLLYVQMECLHQSEDLVKSHRRQIASLKKDKYDLQATASRDFDEYKILNHLQYECRLPRSQT